MCQTSVRAQATTFALAVGSLLPERRRADVCDAVARPLRAAVAQYDELEYERLGVDGEMCLCVCMHVCEH